jgi:3-phenylpropionate/trans-cinnamate dioxygenase ferredoxin reductase component
MADRDVDVLIVGTGPAGVACATTLRDESFEGSILLVGREPDQPYDRPPTSKDYLAGDTAREALLLHEEAHWADQGIELLTRTMVMKLDPAAKEVALANKTTIGYDKLLLATGANVKRLRVENAALDGIHYLRAPGNADTLRADLEGRSRVVLIGGSYIACEVAATLTALGKSCTLVAMEEQPLATGFGPAVGAWVAGRLAEHGIGLELGETLAGFDGEDRVTAVRTASGKTLAADVVVMGTGATPDVMVAQRAGLALGDTGGLACDAQLRTSADGVWAAGDVCEYDSVVHGRRLRVEHWEHATAQGAFAARAMLGAEQPFTEVPYFWSDLADWLSYESVGPAASWDQEVVRGSFDEGAFTVFYLDGGKVVQAMTVGRSDDLDEARSLIASGEPADAEALAAT